MDFALHQQFGQDTPDHLANTELALTRTLGGRVFCHAPLYAELLAPATAGFMLGLFWAAQWR
jgi:hypothetical protein